MGVIARGQVTLAAVNDGKGIKTMTEYYALSASSTVPPTEGWGTEKPTRPRNRFLWMKIVTVYTDNTSTATDPLCVTGETGNTGMPGLPAPSFSWLEEWDNNKTVIGTDKLISPKLFSGTKDSNNKLTGVAVGREVVSVGSLKKSGVFGIKDGEIKFSLDAETGDAVINDAELNDCVVNGSLRSPFTTVEKMFDTGFTDNVALCNTSGVWTTVYHLPWDISQSGRRIVLVNYKWHDGSVNSNSTEFAKLVSPEGKYFFVDGKEVGEYNMTRESVELLGYGSSQEFYGWIVLSRTGFPSLYSDQSIYPVVEISKYRRGPGGPKSYVKWSNYLLEQTFTTTLNANSSKTVNFPVAYTWTDQDIKPAVFYSVLPKASGTFYSRIAVTASTWTYVTFYNYDGVSVDLRCYARGYSTSGKMYYE